MAPYTSVANALTAIKTDESKVLGLTVGDKKVTPGLKIPKAEAQNAPELSFSGTGTYLAVCLDVDAPFASLPVLGPIMHWIQPGYKADASGKLVTTDPVVASYIGPAPPPLASPHRYVFFIYEQPADFDASLHKLSPQEPPPVTKRMFYNIGTLEEKAKLGPILAVNYFVSN